MISSCRGSVCSAGKRSERGFCADRMGPDVSGTSRFKQSVITSEDLEEEPLFAALEIPTAPEPDFLDPCPESVPRSSFAMTHRFLSSR